MNLHVALAALLLVSPALTTTTATDAFHPLAADPGKRVTKRDIVRAMGKTLPEVDIKRMPLNEVFDFLQKESGVPWRIEWDKIEKAGVKRDVRISIKGTDVALDNILGAALNFAEKYDNLKYVYTDSAVVVTAR